MAKLLLIIIILGLLAYIFFDLYQMSEPFSDLNPLAKKYTSKGVEDLGSANLVTSVVVTYRGLDTLGEVTVLFLAAIAIGFILGKKNINSKSIKKASEILTIGSDFLLPLIILFGVYIFIHGHLTPGGGFQGGVIIASGALLSILANKSVFKRETTLNLIESLSGLFYLITGLLGLMLTGSFLDNRFLPLGEPGKLISAGAIPLIYTLIGLKVGAELVSILKRMGGSR